MSMLTSLSDFGEWLGYILILALPVSLGLFMCIKSPFAKGQRMKCSYCKEMISVSASICPYCGRKNRSYSTVAIKSRLGQFMIGFFLGGILDGVLVFLVFKLLQIIGF